MSASAVYDSLLLEYRPKPIHSDRAYRKALKEVDKLMRSDPGSAEKDLIELLSTLIAQYESEAHPAPEVSPSQMLEHLIDARGLTRAELARQTGIPRSTITNVINGNRGISNANASRLGAFFNVSPSILIEAGG